MRTSDISRFESKIERIPEGGCWVWMGAKFSSTPYGQFSIRDENGNRKTVSAHRFSFAVHRGAVVDGMCVCHTCDNPLCVNPSHLFLGTSGDNNRDRAKKNRSFRPVGELKSTHKLSTDQVALLRSMSSLSLHEAKRLAAEWGVSWRHLYKVRSGERWACEVGSND